MVRSAHTARTIIKLGTGSSQSVRLWGRYSRAPKVGDTIKFKTKDSDSIVTVGLVTMIYDEATNPFYFVDLVAEFRPWVQLVEKRSGWGVFLS